MNKPDRYDDGWIGDDVPATPSSGSLPVSAENDGPTEEEWAALRSLYHGSVEAIVLETLEIDGYADVGQSHGDISEELISIINSHISLHTAVPFRLESIPAAKPFAEREIYLKRLD